MRSYCLARTSSSTSSCPRHVANRRAPPAMIRGLAGPSRSGNINETTVGAPGAQPGALGGRKPQNNSYVAGFLGEYTPPAPLLSRPARQAAHFGTGAPRAAAHRPTIPSVRWGPGPSARRSRRTTSRRAAFTSNFSDRWPIRRLNPTARPGVEQNTREKSDCQIVKTAKYKALYEQAWGEPIDCKQQGDPPAYHISFKRLAVAVAAWQGSPDVNSFSSPRDACIRRQPDPTTAYYADGKFPCDNLSARRIWATTCSMAATLGSMARGGNAGCSACHNNNRRWVGR